MIRDTPSTYRILVRSSPGVHRHQFVPPPPKNYSGANDLAFILSASLKRIYPPGNKLVQREAGSIAKF